MRGRRTPPRPVSGKMSQRGRGRESEPRERAPAARGWSLGLTGAKEGLPRAQPTS